MIEEKWAGRPEFAQVRRAIERRDPDLMIGMYAEDARVSIVNCDIPKSTPLELRGKARIARDMREAFGLKLSQSIEREFFEENRMVFWKVSQHPDGNLGVVETTLEFRDGEIVRQLDEILLDGQATCEERVAQEEAVARGAKDDHEFRPLPSHRSRQRFWARRRRRPDDQLSEHKEMQFISDTTTKEENEGVQRR